MQAITFTFKVRAEPFDGLVVLQTSGSSEAQSVVTQIYFGFFKKRIIIEIKSK
jgi:hypothetical protein